MGRRAMADGVLKQEGYDLMAAAFEVYNEKGHGFAEGVYQECLEIELGMRGIPFEAQKEIGLSYKGKPLRHTYKPDLITFCEIIVELKAIRTLGNDEMAQLMNYLKATGKRVGYLINFGAHPKLEWKRIIMNH
jgi:GxxExxY protein